MNPKVKIVILSSLAGAASASVILTVISQVTKPQPIQTIPYEMFSSEGPPLQAPPPVPQQKGIIRVVKTGNFVETTKDPIWKVELVVDGRVEDSVEAVIGRSYRQAVNRHISGNESPLPVGNYRVDRGGIVRERFSNPELGSGYWIPVTPLFSTGRSALGIHQDPSWGKLNNESGTSGCIGLKTAEDTSRVVEWIRKYGIGTLVVQS